jgi:hypothetical protein
VTKAGSFKETVTSFAWHKCATSSVNGRREVDSDGIRVDGETAKGGAGNALGDGKKGQLWPCSTSIFHFLILAQGTVLCSTKQARPGAQQVISCPTPHTRLPSRRDHTEG